MDLIRLRGLRALGVHGVLPEERERAQPFEVDLDLELDLGPAAESDDLADTLDYGAVAQRAVAVVSAESHALVERVASRIADDILALDPRVISVVVTVWKLRPPVAVALDAAGVRVERRRSEP